MDYGYQLLRHVLQQVFGNLKEAAQLTLLLFLAPFIGFVLAGAGAMGIGGGMTDPAGAGAGFLTLLLLLIVSIVAYCWAAVGWHRYVLLEETGNGIVPQWRQGQVISYFGRAFIVGLVVLLAALAGGLVIGLVAGATQSVGIALFLGIGLVFGVSWLATRIGLVLPAAAIGERMTIRESWEATRPVSSQILLPLIVVALAVGILGQIILFIFGQSTTVEMFGVVQEQVTLSFVGQILNGVVSWLQLLINLALMTTLYGNLIEGRQLN